MLSLDLVEKVIVALVEEMHANVTVLSSGAVALASGVRSDGVLVVHVSKSVVRNSCILLSSVRRRSAGSGTYQRTKMATDTADLLLENLVVEPRLELSLSG